MSRLPWNNAFQDTLPTAYDSPAFPVLGEQTEGIPAERYVRAEPYAP